MKEPLTLLSKWHNQITYWKMRNYYIPDPTVCHAGEVYTQLIMFIITRLEMKYRLSKFRQPVRNQDIIRRGLRTPFRTLCGLILCRDLVARKSMGMDHNF
jgi:hypothetical protein